MSDFLRSGDAAVEVFRRGRPAPPLKSILLSVDCWLSSWCDICWWFRRWWVLRRRRVLRTHPRRFRRGGLSFWTWCAALSSFVCLGGPTGKFWGSTQIYDFKILRPILNILWKTDLKIVCSRVFLSIWRIQLMCLEVHLRNIWSWNVPVFGLMKAPKCQKSAKSKNSPSLEIWVPNMFLSIFLYKIVRSTLLFRLSWGALRASSEVQRKFIISKYYSQF